MRFTDVISRGLFFVASLALLLLSLALVGYAGYRILQVFQSAESSLETTLLDAVGYVVIAIAVFDVSKYLLEEEVLRGRELSSAGEARRSLTKFISTIIIAVFLEALVTIFEAAKEDVTKLLQPTLLLLTGALLLVALGVFQRLTATVEQEVGETVPEDGGRQTS